MLCREHGKQLKELAADTDKNLLDGFELFGIIKETGVVSDVAFFVSTRIH